MTREQALKNIKYGWIAGLVSAGVTLALALLPAFGVKPLLGMDLWTLIDVALILGLTYGIYRKNRAAAVTMFVYFVGSKIYFWVQFGTIGSPIITILFGVIFFQSMRGSFAYHRLGVAQDIAGVAPINPNR